LDEGQVEDPQSTSKWKNSPFGRCAILQEQWLTGPANTAAAKLAGVLP